MRVLLLASYCDDDGCCEELPCENCLIMCNVIRIDPKTAIAENFGGYDYLRDMAKEDNALDEEAARMKMKEREGWRTCGHSCEACPDEHTCLGEEG